MYMICTDLRNKLSIEITSFVLFIKINGPPNRSIFSGEICHALVERNTGRPNDKREITEKGSWNFL